MEEEKNKTKQKRDRAETKTSSGPGGWEWNAERGDACGYGEGEGVLVIKHAKSCVTCSDKTWADITTRWTRSSCASLQPPDRPLSLRRQRYHLEASHLKTQASLSVFFLKFSTSIPFSYQSVNNFFGPKNSLNLTLRLEKSFTPNVWLFGIS